MAVTKEKLVEVLTACDGIASEVAKRLQITPQAVRKRLREDTELKSVQLESREGLVDLAQSKLRGLVDSGDFRAVKFVLETWGRDRGFTREVKVDASHEQRGKVILMLPDNGRQDLSFCSRKPVS
jgi:hypothetical protein